MKKINKLFNFLINYLRLEDFIILTLVFGVFITILKQFSWILSNIDNNSNLLISVVVVSLAYATFFVNYQKNLGRENDKRKIKILIDGLFISSFFPIIAILFVGEDIGFGYWDKYIAYFFIVLIIASLFLMSFCVIELWWYMVKNFFSK